MIELKNVTLACIDCIDINRAFKAIDICEKEIKFADSILLTSIKLDDKRIVPIKHIGSIQEYSRFMIKDLVRYIDTEYVLCIQWDGYVLNANAWTNEFLKFDYIGAAWYFRDNMNVGNGGFSLRSKKYLEVCSKLPLKNFHPEDQVLNRTYRHLLEKEGIKYAPESLARRFSHEGNNKFGTKWDGQFGWHDSEVTNLCNYSGELPEFTKRDQEKYWNNKYGETYFKGRF